MKDPWLLILRPMAASSSALHISQALVSTSFWLLLTNGKLWGLGFLGWRREKPECFLAYFSVPGGTFSNDSSPPWLQSHLLCLPLCQLLLSYLESWLIQEHLFKHLCTVVEMQTVQSLWETLWRFFKKIKDGPAIWPSDSISGYISKETPNTNSKNICPPLCPLACYLQ